jgi:hypothetical protein
MFLCERMHTIAARNVLIHSRVSLQVSNITLLWRVSLVTRQIISGFWILWSIYWLHVRRNLQLLITVAISLYSHCINSSPADLSYSSGLLIPIRYLACVLLVATNIHRYCIHHFELKLKTVFMLAHCSHYLYYTVLTLVLHCTSESGSESYITTDSQSGSLSWNKAPIWTRYLFVFDNYGPVFVSVLSDERTGLTFVYAAGTRQRSLSWVRVPLDS